MKKILNVILLCSLGLFWSCDGDVDGVSLDNLTIYPSDEFSATIHFVSKLTDASIGSSDSDYAAINNYFASTLNKKNGSWMGIVERTDVTYSASYMSNRGVTLGDISDHWSFFALNKMSGLTSFEGSTVLFNAPSTSIISYELGTDSRIYAFSPTMEGLRTNEDGTTTAVSFPIYLRYGRIETASNVSAFLGSDAAFVGSEGVFKELRGDAMNMLLVGTVKSNLFSSLESGVTQLDPDFRVVAVSGTESKDYTVFLLFEKRFWQLDECSSTSLGNGVEAYSISVNW